MMKQILSRTLSFLVVHGETICWSLRLLPTVETHSTHTGQSKSRHVAKSDVFRLGRHNPPSEIADISEK